MTTTLKRTNQAGFTLVELAIVLMIIGLLIGGILRGQELMENARVTTTIQQTKAYDGAATAFRDAYSAMPGDMQVPNNRLPNCPTGSQCGTAGDGNGLLGPLATQVVVLRTGADNNAVNSEHRNFWLHMAVARLISGVDASGPATPVSWGIMFPAAKIAGGFHVASMNVPANGVITPAFSGLFLILRNAPAAGPILEGDGLSAISPIRAAQFDRKLDDGLPNTGDVIGVSSNAGGCVAAAAGGGYTETIEQRNCNLLIRVQS